MDEFRQRVKDDLIKNHIAYVGFLPCKFCGSKGYKVSRITHCYTEGVEETTCEIDCAGCAYRICAPNEKSAIAEWNQRANHDSE